MRSHSKELTSTVNTFLLKDSCFLQLNIIDLHNYLDYTVNSFPILKINHFLMHNS